MNRIEIGQRLKRLREDLNLSRKEIANLVNIGTTTLQQWEVGTREASIEIIHNLAQVYKTTPQYIIFGDSAKNAKSLAQPTNKEKDEYEYIPFYDIQASAGLGLFTDGAEAPTKYLAFRKRWVHAKGLQNNNLVGLLTKGDSMEPTIQDGAVIIIDITQTTPVDGGLYVVRIEENLYIKRIQRIPRGLRLISDNSRYDPLDINISEWQDDQLQVCGKLIHTSHDL